MEISRWATKQMEVRVDRNQMYKKKKQIDKKKPRSKFSQKILKIFNKIEFENLVWNLIANSNEVQTESDTTSDKA